MEPNRETGKKKINTISGISSWFEWRWPVDGLYAGYIQARSLPNIGDWNSIPPTKFNKNNTELLKPEPFISTPSIPNSPWTVPSPNESNPKRRKVELLKEHQENPEAINLQGKINILLYFYKIIKQ